MAGVWEVVLNRLDDPEAEFLDDFIEGELSPEIIRDYLERKTGVPVILIDSDPENYVQAKPSEIVRAAKKMKAPILAVIEEGEEDMPYFIGLFVAVGPGSYVGEPDAMQVETVEGE